jgi:hypothetical protein
MSSRFRDSSVAGRAKSGFHFLNLFVGLTRAPKERRCSDTTASIGLVDLKGDG